MPASSRTTRANAKAVDLSVKPDQTKKPRAGRATRKGPKVDNIPTESAEGGISPTAPAPIAPKKQGRKPKQVTAAADSLPPPKKALGNNPEDANQPAGDTVGGTGAAPKTPIPIREPLPLREGRNTHPGLRDGVQPTPRRFSQDVAAERQHKRLELEAKLCAAEEAKNMLAQMELEDERIVEEIEEECRQPLDRHLQGQTGIPESDCEEIEGVAEVDYDTDEEPEEESEEKETCKGKVSPHISSIKSSITY
jgi:hypothetical protein